MALLKRKKLLFSLLLVLSVFLIARLPFFLFTPIPEPQTEDTPEYFEVVMQMLSNQPVNFSIIPIGYPLFILIVGLFSNTLIALTIVQNLISLFSVLLFIYSIHKNFPKLTIWSAVIFAGYLATENNMHWDSHFTPDSLYANLLIIFISCLIITVKNKNIVAALLTSFFAAAVLLVRTSSIFVLPIILLVLIYMIYNKYGTKNIIALITPCIFILFVYSCYNWHSINSFNFIPTGRFGATKSFLKKYETRKPEDQLFINNVKGFLPDSNEFNLIDYSWNVKKVNKAYLETRFGNELYIDSLGYLTLKTFFMKKFAVDTIILPENQTAFNSYKDLFLQKFDTSKCTIILERNVLKYRLINFAAYFLNFTEKLDFYNYEWGWRYWFFYVGRCQTWAYPWHTHATGIEGKPIADDLRIFTYKEMVNYPLKNKADFVAAKSERNESYIYRIYYKLKVYFIQPFFRNSIWILIFISGFILSIIQSIKTKFRDENSLILFCICSIQLGSAVIFSIYGAHTRYSFTTEFTYYAVAALLPVFINFTAIINKIKAIIKK